MSIDDIGDSIDKLLDNKWKIAKWTAGGIVGLSVLGSTWYTVDTNESALVQTFGAHTDTKPAGGPYFKAPWPISTVKKLETSQVQKVEFGFRTLEAGVDSTYLDSDSVANVDEDAIDDFINENGLVRGDNPRRDVAEALEREYSMLTGDLNMANVEFLVQYQISDPAAYSFNVDSQVQTIRDEGLNVMRRLVGNGSVDDVITLRRQEYQATAKNLLQEKLDQYQLGVTITELKIQASDPPLSVQSSYNNVNKAEQEKKKMRDKALAEQNTRVPEKKGEAKQIVSNAEGYAAKRLNEAKGLVARYDALYTQYQHSPENTASRLYFESMGRIMPYVGKTTFIELGTNGSGVLPLLPLGGSKGTLQNYAPNLQNAEDGGLRK